MRKVGYIQNQSLRFDEFIIVSTRFYHIYGNVRFHVVISDRKAEGVL